MSNAHISDELPLLLSGEASRDVVMDAADHLRSCPDCQQDLVSAVVAHASLTSAHRFAPEVVSATPEETHPLGSADDHESASVGSLPDLSGVFAQVRTEAAVTAAQPSRRRRTALLSVAAAAVVAAGTAAVVESTSDSGSKAPSATAVTLVNSVSGRAPSIATIVGPNRLKIDATSLPPLDSRHQYEVWLTSPSTASHPQSIGFIDPDRRADLTVPAKIMAQYSIIAVSKQGLHQTRYSGETVAHGTYRD